MEPSVPQTPQGTVQGRAAADWGSTTRSKTSSRTQQQRGNQSDAGTGTWGREGGRMAGGSPQRTEEKHAGKRLGAGQAELAGLRLLALTTMCCLMAPPAFLGRRRRGPGLHSRAARLGVIPPFLHPSAGGDQAPPNHPSCLVRPVLLETGSGAETSLPSMDAGGASPSGCW